MELEAITRVKVRVSSGRKAVVLLGLCGCQQKAVFPVFSLMLWIVVLSGQDSAEQETRGVVDR